MKLLNRTLVIVSLAKAAAVCALCVCAAGHANETTLRVGVVNFRECVDQSKLGKREQQQFEDMRRKLEGMLEEKEKKLNEISAKFSDADFVDGLSPEAEQEMKRQYSMLGQEMSQLQGQYYQVLNQANVKILQKLADIISEASQTVAKERNVDIILNQDGTFFYQEALNLTKDVVKQMDLLAEKKEASEQNG